MLVEALFLAFYLSNACANSFRTIKGSNRGTADHDRRKRQLENAVCASCFGCGYLDKGLSVEKWRATRKRNFMFAPSVLQNTPVRSGCGVLCCHAGSGSDAGNPYLLNCRISQCCPARVSISGRAIRLLSDILIRLPAVNQGTVRGENDHDLSIRRNFLESRAISYAGKKNSNSAKEFAGTTT